MVEIKRHSSCLSTDAVGTACERFSTGWKSLGSRGMVFCRASKASAVVGGLIFAFGSTPGGVITLESLASMISHTRDVDC